MNLINRVPRRTSRASIQFTLSRILFHSVLVLLATSALAFASPQAPAISAPITAQQQPSGAPSEEVKAVYVTVAEQDGTPISNLKLADFSIVENKKSQPIVEVTSAVDIPLVLCLLVDMSGSARGNLSRNKDWPILFRFLIQSIGPSDRAFIEWFNDESRRVTRITNNASELRIGLTEIANLEPRGSTALYDSILDSIAAMHSNQLDRRIVLVIGDFQDNVSHISLEKTVTAVRQSGASVFALIEAQSSDHHGRDQKHASEAAARIVRESGGFEFTFQSPTELENALKKLRLLLRPTYRITYRTNTTPKNGKLLTPTLEVPGRNAIILVASTPTTSAP